jgi:hypothetical protein
VASAIKLSLAGIQGFFVTMKPEIRIISLAAAWILGMGANLTSAIPVANQQGDYPVPPARQRGSS